MRALNEWIKIIAYILIKVKVRHDSRGIPSKSKGVTHKIQDIDQGDGGNWK